MIERIPDFASGEDILTPILGATLWLDGTPSIAEGDLQLIHLPA